MRPCCVLSCPNPVRTGSRAQRMHSNTQRCPVPHVRCIKRGTSILDHSVLINTSLPAELSRIDRAQFAGGGEEEIAYHPVRLVPPPSNLNLNSLPIDIGAICNRITNSNSLGTDTANPTTSHLHLDIDCKVSHETEGSFQANHIQNTSGQLSME